MCFSVCVGGFSGACACEEAAEFILLKEDR